MGGKPVVFRAGNPTGQVGEATDLWTCLTFT